MMKIIKLLLVLLTLAVSLTMLGANTDAANWYVDKDAVGANNGTSWQDAWTSFSNIVWGTGGIVAGDTLYISGGSVSKTYTEKLWIQASGTPENPITIRPGQDPGHNGIVIIDMGYSGEAIRIGPRSNIVINGEYNGERHIKLYRGSLGDGYDALIYATGANNIKYYYLELKTAATGIRQNSQTSSSKSEVAYCYIHDIRGQCAIDFTMGSSQTPAAHGHFKIHHNIIKPVWEKYNGGTSIKGPDGIQATGSVEFYNNQVIGMDGGMDTGVVVGGQHPDFIQAQNGYWKIYNNDFIDIGDAAIDFDAFLTHYIKHVHIYNNVFAVQAHTSTYPQGIRFYDSSSQDITEMVDVLIANNTFVDLFDHYPLRLGGGSTPRTMVDVYIQNNLFYNCGISYAIDSPNSGADQSDWHFDYNLVNAGNSGSDRIQLDGVPYTQAHGVAGAPSFVYYSEKSASNDYHFRDNTSPGVDAGIDLSPYFNTDKDGVPRPQSSAWDIGAYEFRANGSQLSPEPPSNLRIN
ncbi:MAG: hypothetical protein JRH08_04535 [Deltaproteobacteria bacterium]|nr:hypothetical protein [Deltaproteobacteria bacterium]MBW2024939.1 hypothetical protein [Deltaproteobacteria bacterium]MBW2124968.1 hypothetical protein [Deltaproteobacteria bacterium]